MHKRLTPGNCHLAIVLCSPLAREYLINYARSLIYTTAMPFPTLASIRTAYELMSRGDTEPVCFFESQLGRIHSLLARCLTCLLTCSGIQLRLQLQALIRHFSATLDALLIKLPQLSALLQMHHHRNSPIISLQTPHPRELAAFCQKSGFIVRPIMPPTIPAGTERVRICLHAGNTVAEVNEFADVLKSWVATHQKTISRL